MKLSIDQSPLALQMLRAKLRRISLPYTEWRTSGVELDTVNVFIWVFDGCVWAVSWCTCTNKVRRNLSNRITMAHQNSLLVWCWFKKSWWCVSKSWLTVFTIPASPAGQLSSKFMGQQLHTITNSQNRNSEFEDSGSISMNHLHIQSLDHLKDDSYRIDFTNFRSWNFMAL